MRSRPWMKWLIGAGVVVVLAVGGFLVYWNFIKSDAEDPFELTEVETDGTTTETTDRPPARRRRPGDLRHMDDHDGQRGRVSRRGDPLRAVVGRHRPHVRSDGQLRDRRHDDRGRRSCDRHARECRERREPARQPVPRPHHGCRDVPDCVVRAHRTDRARVGARPSERRSQRRRPVTSRSRTSRSR